MAVPQITDFGDDDHEEGETSLTVNGFDFGHFTGELWMFENADRSGAADQLTVGTWADQRLTGVEIPASPNNSPGTVYLAAKTEGNEWSSPAFPYPFTLSAASGGAVISGAFDAAIFFLLQQRRFGRRVRA